MNNFTVYINYFGKKFKGKQETLLLKYAFEILRNKHYAR